ARVDAGRAEKQQLFDASATRRLDYVSCDHQIIVQKVTGMDIVRVNPADPRGGEQYRLRPMLIEPAVDCRLVAQINRITAGGKNSAFLLREPADQCRTDHAAIAGDKYASSAE